MAIEHTGQPRICFVYKHHIVVDCAENKYNNNKPPPNRKLRICRLPVLYKSWLQRCSRACLHTMDIDRYALFALYSSHTKKQLRSEKIPLHNLMPIYDILESKANALQPRSNKGNESCMKRAAEKKPVERVDEKLQQNWTSFVRARTQTHMCINDVTSAHFVWS